MQDIVLCFDILKTQGKLVSFYWIPLYKDIKGNEKVDIIAKKVIRYKKAKMKNGKCKKWDSRYILEKQKLGRS